MLRAARIKGFKCVQRNRFSRTDVRRHFCADGSPPWPTRQAAEWSPNGKHDGRATQIARPKRGCPWEDTEARSLQLNHHDPCEGIQTLMTRLHFIGGEKGGVGKSVVARIVAQYFIDRKIPFLGFDSDGSHGSLLRFYADFAAPVVIDRYEGLDHIVEAAAEEPGRRIIVDLAAQTHRFLAQWIEDSGLLDIGDELGLSVTYWHVMDSGRDSAN